MVLGKNGEPDYRLILLPGEVEGVDWKSAQEWAEKCGGFLPTRREQSILFGNLKEKFKEAVYWSGERHESNSGWAWSQNFGYGDQYDDGQSRRFRARAVRRLSI
ncbi:DUF1566 domain-containing protein [Burkholderia contaminans]|nr:DUF1566 domain-containing protein [Burkholderia contaminans]